jgi:hypothetical protein
MSKAKRHAPMFIPRQRLAIRGPPCFAAGNAAIHAPNAPAL